MEKRERKPDTLKQKRTRHYVRIILGVYLIYTAYSIVRDLRADVSADRPVLFYAAAALFLAVGAVLAVTSFRAAMKISGEELKQTETGSGMSADEEMEAGTKTGADAGEISADMEAGTDAGVISADVEEKADVEIISADTRTGVDASDTLL